MESTTNTSPNEQVKFLREENERLKDDLFALMPVQNQVSDSSLQDGFAQLCRSIDNLVEDINIDDLRDISKNRERKVWHLRSRLLKDEGASQRLLRHRNGTDYFVLSVAVRRLLQKLIFSELYPIGITGHQTQVIHEIVESMERITVREERLRVDRWRSEAIVALTSRSGYARIQSHEIRKILKSIKQTLSNWVFHEDVIEKQARTLDEIVSSAVKLHQGMQSSTFRYRLWYPDLRRSERDQEFDTMWTLRDLDKWMNIKTSSVYAQPIHCIYPALVRLPQEREPAIVLVNPIIVADSTTHSETPETLPLPESYPTSPIINPMMAPITAEQESFDREESWHSPQRTTVYKLVDGTIRGSPQSSTTSAGTRSDVLAETKRERLWRSEEIPQPERKRERETSDRRSRQKSPGTKGWVFW